ncbi:MAG: hypothetical protein QNJ98_18815 [Planctomycetota bacterium]|nr:hypothetical protein [Planctomycetota bacterium]
MKRVALSVLMLVALVPVAQAEEPPTPNADRIDYAKPDAYRRLDPMLGDAKAIQGLAAQLAKKDAASTLRAIWLWAKRNLRPAEAETSTWRSVSDMIRAGTRTSEAEAAIAIGTLARAASIPTAYVKTLDVAWLKAGATGAIQERTFLELHIEGAWRLLDPVAMRLYDRYDPKTRLLPGDRLAFDKGGDPHALVLPNRSALYQAQVARFAKAFDVRRLPWGVSRDLLAPIKVYVAGRAPITRYVTATCDTMGFLVADTFTAKEFDRLWPEIKGGILVVTTHEGAPDLPQNRWKDVLPAGAAKLPPDAKPTAYLTRTLPDQTVVIYTSARSYAGVEVAIARALSELKR